MASIIIRVFVILGVVTLAAYLFESSFLGAAILLTVVFFFGAIVTEGEYMPGEYDNPDGEETHPFVIIGVLIFIFVSLIVIGFLFPSLYEYGFYGS